MKLWRRGEAGAARGTRRGEGRTSAPPEGRSSRRRGAAEARPNRLVAPRAGEGEAERPTTPQRGARARRRVQTSAVWRGLRRVGFVFWPERYPDLMAERASRLAERSRARGFIWVWAVAVALAAGAFVWHLDVRFRIIQTGYALSRAQAEQRRLRLSQRELRLEMATLKEPGRIEAQAREQLGMDRPDHDRIIHLDGRRRPRLARRGGAR